MIKKVENLKGLDQVKKTWVKTSNNQFPEQSLAGLGLRSEHYSYLEKNTPKEVKWFEAVSENYMNSQGRPREFLRFIRQKFPIALHGVGMSLASFSGVKDYYLKTLKELINEVDPFLVSDHLCWTGGEKANLHDLLPFPFTEESLSIVVNNIDYVQNYLQREILVENVSTYMTFNSSEMSERDFVVEVVKRSGARILLDVNNIYVNAVNHGFDAKDYLDAVPINSVGQIHLAGYSDLSDYLFDTHSKPVWPEVWSLFSHLIQKKSDIPFMVEWDEDIPDFLIVEKELKKAKEIWESFHREEKLSNCVGKNQNYGYL